MGLFLTKKKKPPRAGLETDRVLGVLPEVPLGPEPFLPREQGKTSHPSRDTEAPKNLLTPAPGLWTPLSCFPLAEGNPFTMLFPASLYEPQRLSAQEHPLPKVILTKPLLRATHEPAGQYKVDHLKSDLLAGTGSRT